MLAASHRFSRFLARYATCRGTGRQRYSAHVDVLVLPTATRHIPVVRGEDDRIDSSRIALELEDLIAATRTTMSVRMPGFTPFKRTLGRLEKCRT